MGDVANIEQHKRMLGQPRYSHSHSQASSDKEREDTALGHSQEDWPRSSYLNITEVTHYSSLARSSISPSSLQ